MPISRPALLACLLALPACGGSQSSANDAAAPDSQADGTSSGDDATSTTSADATSDTSGTTDAATRPPDAATDAAKTDGGTSTGQWVLGYYVGYDIHSYPIASIDWTALTHIAFAPLVLNGDLSLDLSFNDEYGTGTADTKALSAAAHAHGVKALMMLGGAGAGGNIATAASASHRAKFVSDLIAALGTLGYDGIDLDWEDSVNLDDLVALAQALRAAKSDIILSYPAGALNSNFDTVDPRMVTLAASLDRFNVQTYYPSTAYAGSGWSSWFSSPISGISGSTPIAIDDTLKRYADAGIPKAKLGMGMAFYAICYTGGITGPRQATDGTSQRIVGGDNTYPSSAFFAGGGTFDKSAASEQKRDGVAQVPYLSFAAPKADTHCGGNTQYITYDDETAIKAKGTFSKTQGYGGIIIWTINEGWLPAGAAGGRAQNALMQALKAGFL